MQCGGNWVRISRASFAQEERGVSVLPVISRFRVRVFFFEYS